MNAAKLFWDALAASLSPLAGLISEGQLTFTIPEKGRYRFTHHIAIDSLSIESVSTMTCSLWVHAHHNEIEDIVRWLAPAFWYVVVMGKDSQECPIPLVARPTADPQCARTRASYETALMLEKEEADFVPVNRLGLLERQFAFLPGTISEPSSFWERLIN